MADAEFLKSNLRDNFFSPVYDISDLPDLDDTSLISQRQVPQAKKFTSPRKVVSIAVADDRKEVSDAEEEDEQPAIVLTISGCTGPTAKRVNGEYTQRGAECDHGGRSTFIGATIDGEERVCVWYHEAKRAWMVSRTSQIGQLSAYAICKCTAENPWEVSDNENWLVYTPEKGGANFEGQKLRIKKKDQRPVSPNVRNSNLSEEQRVEYMQFAMKEQRSYGMNLYSVNDLPDLE